MITRTNFTLAHVDAPDNKIAIPAPSFGYTVELVKALVIERFTQCIDVHDRGIEHDYRTVEFTSLIHKDVMPSIAEFLSSVVGQSDRFVITLPTGSGFFVGGPDKGDGGEFVVSLASNPQYSAMKINPFGHFSCKLKLLIHQYPQVDFSVAPSEGVFGFGYVAGLRDPAIAPTQEFTELREITMGGDVSTIRRATPEFTVQINQTATTAKMAELIRFIHLNRGNSIPLTTGKHYWLFGPDNMESGQVRAKLLDSNFIMTHSDWDNWNLNIRLWMEVLHA